MTRDPARSVPNSQPIDDERLASLVNASVADWRLPPQRLDQVTWREVVEAGSGGGRTRRVMRLARPLVAATVATVAVAFAAIWLTSPGADRGVGVSASPSTGIPGSTPSLPPITLTGDLPRPARLLVWSPDGYRIADLSTGALGPVSVASDAGQTIIARPGGGWVCICAAWTGSDLGHPSGIGVSLETLDSTGAVVSRIAIRTIRGSADPALSSASQPQLVDARAFESSDGRTAFVGWSARAGAAGWTAGVDVVDLATGSILDTTDLPLTPPTDAATPVTRLAPRVELDPTGAVALISSYWYAEDGTATPPVGTDHWTAPFDGHGIGTLTPDDAPGDASCVESTSGQIDASRSYRLCVTTDGRTDVLVVANGGRVIDRAELASTGGGPFAPVFTMRGGDALFAWDPIATRLSRFDLLTGTVTSGTATAAVGPAGPIEALAGMGRDLGRWLAPSVAAKVLLEPAMVISPDGTRVYALGIDPIADGGRSRGVYVFDGETVESLGRWAPTADYVSLAVSGDGRFVYAAGQPGPNSAVEPASITAYDTSDGSVREIVRELGPSTVLFPGRVVR